MIVSPFTPLFFIDHKSDGISSDYIQTFATSDRILLQLICSKGEDITAAVIDENKESTLYEIVFNRWTINDDTDLLFTTITLSHGLYSVEIAGYGKCEPFHVTDNPQVLKKTTLIQYSMHNNRQRDDAVFFIDGMQYFFDFRVPGGFKDSNWTFGVESEQFVTDKADILQLYALDSVQQKFTMGTSRGCPVWFATLLNRLLCCTYVYFDGIRYARKESSVPEINVQLDGINSFVFTQNLQKVNYLDSKIEEKNQAIIRRIAPETYRTVPTLETRLIY